MELGKTQRFSQPPRYSEYYTQKWKESTQTENTQLKKNIQSNLNWWTILLLSLGIISPYFLQMIADFISKTFSCLCSILFLLWYFLVQSSAPVGDKSNNTST